MHIRELINLIPSARTTGNNRWQAKCPAHEDDQASLSVSQGDKGILVHCHAGCTLDDICGALNLKPSDLFSDKPEKQKKDKPKSKPVGKPIEYTYQDEHGNIVMQAIRQQLDNGKKTFKQRLWREAYKDWSWSIPKDQKRYPYKLPQLLKSAADDRMVFVCEGEKDVDEMAARGFVATCNIGGAGKWVVRDRDDYSEWLKGRHVVILPDNDEPGQKHAQQVAQALQGQAKTIKIVNLPDLPVKGDVYDWWQSGGTLEQFKKLVADQSPWQPCDAPSQGGKDQNQTANRASHGPLFRARKILESDFTVNGLSTIKRWRDNWYTYRGTHFEQTKRELLEAKLYRIIDLQGYKCDKKIIGDLLHAIPAAGNVIIDDDMVPPFDSKGRIEDHISLKNGILDIKTRELKPHTPGIFLVNTLPFNYDPHAKTPHWDKFIAELFDHDYEAAITLQQWFGYCLSSDTSLQKILLIIGPRRAGKGTIDKILTELLGPKNVAKPTLTSLYTQFGLEPLLDKRAAIIPDARLSGRSDQAVITERLLSISGEDALTIDRKNRPQLPNVSLDCKVTMLTNTLPTLPDSSGALASRFWPIELTESFLGREDRGLLKKLKSELSGILNWALDGLDQLNLHGMRMSQQSQDIADEFTRLSSIVSGFVQDCCETGPELDIGKDELYDAFVKWSKIQGYTSIRTKNVFARDMRSAVPHFKSVRTNTGGIRENRYTGIKLSNDYYIEFSGLGQGSNDFGQGYGQGSVRDGGLLQDEK